MPILCCYTFCLYSLLPTIFFVYFPPVDNILHFQTRYILAPFFMFFNILAFLPTFAIVCYALFYATAHLATHFSFYTLYI